MRSRTLVFLVVLCLAAPLLAGDEQSKLIPAPQASQQGAKGAVIIVNYPGNAAETINSYSVGIKAVLATGGGGAGAGKPEFTSFNFVKRFNSQSPVYLLDCVSGKHVPIVTIDLLDDKGNTVGMIRLTDVMVSSYQTGGGGGDLLTDNVTLNFTKFELVKILIGL